MSAFDRLAEKEWPSDNPRRAHCCNCGNSFTVSDASSRARAVRLMEMVARAAVRHFTDLEGGPEPTSMSDTATDAIVDVIAREAESRKGRVSQ